MRVNGTDHRLSVISRRDMCAVSVVQRTAHEACRDADTELCA